MWHCWLAHRVAEVENAAITLKDLMPVFGNALGAIVGAAVALFVVRLTHGFAEKREQRNAERTERREQRVLLLREYAEFFRFWESLWDASYDKTKITPAWEQFDRACLRLELLETNDDRVAEVKMVKQELKEYAEARMEGGEGMLKRHFGNKPNPLTRKTAFFERVKAELRGPKT